MSKGFDLEAIREIFKDNRTHLAFGQIRQVAVASDRSYVKCVVSILPEKREIVARLTWDNAGNQAGFYMIPAAGDLVVVGFIDGNDDYAVVLKRLSSKEDPIPEAAVDGSSVVRAPAGKKLWLGGDRINLAQGDTQPTEPLVLGTQLQSLLADMLGIISDLATSLASHTHLSAAPSNPTSPPSDAVALAGFATAADSLVTSPVNDGAILSDVAFTEKGS